MKWPTRSRFEFIHADGPNEQLVFKAWSERGAWRRMRAFLMAKLFGQFAMHYYPEVLEAQMRKITCRRISDQGDGDAS